MLLVQVQLIAHIQTEIKLIELEERLDKRLKKNSNKTMNQGPKLYANKPKRAKSKQSLQQGPPLPLTMTSSSSSSSSSTGIGTVTPALVKESFFRRYKFLWPILLAVNLSIGAYLYTKTKKKEVGHEETELHNASSHPPSTSTTAEVASATIPVNPTVVQVQHMPREPISEDHQRELFKWILEEKRKVKPRDAEEKKRIDEEKAILKQFIRSKSVSSK